MEGPTYVTLSAQMALQSQLEVTANNVANVNTRGYKADRQLFQTMVEPMDTAGKNVSFVQDRATYIDSRAGSYESTENPLDMAVQGEGYLAIRTKQGVRYTRDGRMSLDADQTLVDAHGNPYLSNSGMPIQIPMYSTDIKVLGDGTITVLTAQHVLQQVDQIGLFRSARPIGVRKLGDGEIDGTDAVIRPVPIGDTKTRIVQGTVENSSVEAVSEMTRMTDLSQAYTRMQNLISDDNSREQNMISQLGKF